MFTWKFWLMMWALLFMTLGFAITANARECKTDFCHLSQTSAWLSAYPYTKEGITSDVFRGGNCIDFTLEAYKILEARGVKNLKMVTLTKGDLSHMVLLVNDKWVLSAGADGLRILTTDYFQQWEIVEGV